MPKEGRKDVVQKGLEDVCVCVWGGGEAFWKLLLPCGGYNFHVVLSFFFEGGEGKVLIHPTFLKTSVPPSDFNEMQSKVTWDCT